MVWLSYFLRYLECSMHCMQFLEHITCTRAIGHYRKVWLNTVKPTSKDGCILNAHKSFFFFSEVVSIHRHAHTDTILGDFNLTLLLKKVTRHLIKVHMKRLGQDSSQKCVFNWQSYNISGMMKSSNWIDRTVWTESGHKGSCHTTILTTWHWRIDDIESRQKENRADIGVIWQSLRCPHDGLKQLLYVKVLSGKSFFDMKLT